MKSKEIKKVCKTPENINKLTYDNIFTIFQKEFIDSCETILLEKQTPFLEAFFSKISLVIKFKFGENIYQKNTNLYELTNQCENQFITNVYTPMYKLCNNSLQKYFSSPKKTEYKFNFIPHCFNNFIALHTCGSKFLPIFQTSNNPIKKTKILLYLICTECKKCYYGSSIKMYCEHCKLNFYTKLMYVKSNDPESYLLPATWEKYHCNIKNINKQMICFNCGDKIWIKNKNIYCKTCKVEINPMDISWTCFYCKEQFKSQIKIFNPLQHKEIINTVRDALLYKKIVKPKKLPCNCVSGRDIDKLTFVHKPKKCNGKLYYAYIDGKHLLVCSLCSSVTKLVKFFWHCPICFKKFTTNQIKVYTNYVARSNSKIKNRSNSKNNNLSKKNSDINLSDDNNKSINIKKNSNDILENNNIFEYNNSNEIWGRNGRRLLNFNSSVENDSNKNSHNTKYYQLQSQVESTNSSSVKSLLRPNFIISHRLYSKKKICDSFYQKIDINSISQYKKLNKSLNYNKINYDVRDYKIESDNKLNKSNKVDFCVEKSKVNLFKNISGINKGFYSNKNKKILPKLTNNFYMHFLSINPNLSSRFTRFQNQIGHNYINSQNLSAVNFLINNYSQESNNNEEIKKISTNLNTESNHHNCSTRVLSNLTNYPRFQIKEYENNNIDSHKKNIVSELPIQLENHNIINKSEENITTFGNTNSKLIDINKYLNSYHQKIKNKEKIKSDKNLLRNYLTKNIIGEKERKMPKKEKSFAKINFNAYLNEKENSLVNSIKITNEIYNNNIKSEKKKKYDLNNYEKNTEKDKDNEILKINSNRSKKINIIKYFQNDYNSIEKNHRKTTQISHSGRDKQSTEPTPTLSSVKDIEITNLTNINPDDNYGRTYVLNENFYKTNLNKSKKNKDFYKKKLDKNIYEYSIDENKINKNKKEEVKEIEKTGHVRTLSQSPGFKKNNEIEGYKTNRRHKSFLNEIFKNDYENNENNNNDYTTVKIKKNRKIKQSCKRFTTYNLTDIFDYNNNKNQNNNIDYIQNSTKGSLTNFEIMKDKVKLNLSSDIRLKTVNKIANFEKEDINETEIETLKKTVCLKNDKNISKILNKFDKNSQQKIFKDPKKNDNYNNIIQNIGTNIKINKEENEELKEFNFDEYKIITQLGQGTFGKIYLVQNKKGEAFSMKKIVLSEELDVQSVINEYKMCHKLKHPNIVEILGIYNNKLDKTTFVVYVLMEVGITDWEKEIKSLHERKIDYTENQLIFIMKQLIPVLSFLQKNNISHRDIKPQNILVFKNNVYKLADFGEAKKIGFSTLNLVSNSLRGTELYMSPLLFNGLRNGQVDIKHNVFKSDVYSFGLCILYAASTDNKPIFEIRKFIDMDNVKKYVHKVIKNKYSEKFIEFLISMLEIHEKNRPDFVQLEKNLSIWS